jgi:hypothetical protein
VPADERRVVIPSHHCTGTLTASLGQTRGPVTSSFDEVHIGQTAPPSLTASISPTEVVIKDPCALLLEAKGWTEPYTPATTQHDITVRLELWPIRADRPVSLEAILKPRRDAPRVWVMPERPRGVPNR